MGMCGDRVDSERARGTPGRRSAGAAPAAALPKPSFDVPGRPATIGSDRDRPWIGTGSFFHSSRNSFGSEPEHRIRHPRKTGPRGTRRTVDLRFVVFAVFDALIAYRFHHRAEPAVDLIAPPPCRSTNALNRSRSASTRWLTIPSASPTFSTRRSGSYSIWSITRARSSESR